MPGSHRVIRRQKIAPRASRASTLASSSNDLELREQMPEFFLLGSQIVDISNVRRHFQRYSRNRHAVTLKALDLVRIVGQQTDFANAEIAQDLRSDAIVAEIVLEAQFKIRFDRIHPLVLERVGF